jgi:hypothetical protein
MSEAWQVRQDEQLNNTICNFMVWLNGFYSKICIFNLIIDSLGSVTDSEKWFTAENTDITYIPCLT